VTLKAIVLAAGKGEKIAPFGLTRPKTMIPIGNKPLILHILEGLKSIGINDVIIVIGHLGRQVVNCVERIKEKLKVNTTYVRQREPRGTADAILEAKDLIDDDFLVVYGDVLTSKKTYEVILKKFEESGAYVVISVAKPEEAEHRFTASLEGDKVTKLTWWGEGVKVAGMYAFVKEAINYIERNPGIMRSSVIGIMPPIEAELNQSISEMIRDGKEVLAIEVQEYFEDLDFPWNILHANMKYYKHIAKDLRSSKIGKDVEISEKAVIKAPIVVGDCSKIGDNVVITKPTFIGRNSRVDHGAIIEGGMIGDNTVVEKYCEVRAILGNNVRVGHAAEVFGVVFDKVYIVHYSEVTGVIGENTDIGAGTLVGTLRFDSEKPIVRVKRKKYVAESVAYIGDYCRTGVGAMIMPGVRVGPYSIVGPGVVLYEDLEPYKMVLVRQELVKRDWGPNRYGW